MAFAWTVDEDDSRDGVDFIPISAPGLFVAEVYGSADDLSITDEDRARARLIASAPELAKMVKNLIHALDAQAAGADWLQPKIDNTRAAAVALLAKATGEAQ